MGVESTDNLVTRIVLLGAPEATRQMQLLGGATRAYAGDVDAAEKHLKGFNATGLRQLAIGGSMIAGGVMMTRWLRQFVDAAAEAEAVQARLNAAIAATGVISPTVGPGLLALAKSLSAVNRASKFGDEEITASIAMLASFKLTEAQIRGLLPRIIDAAAGSGKGLDQVTMAVGKASQAGGKATMLGRMGVVMDEAEFKARGYLAVIDELDRRFKGQGAASANTYAGNIATATEAMEEFREAVGAGLLPLLKAVNIVLVPVVNAFTWLNDATHGSAGFILGLSSVALVLVGSLMVLRVALRWIKGEWQDIALWANNAFMAQRRAANPGGQMTLPGMAAPAATGMLGGRVGWGSVAGMAAMLAGTIVSGTVPGQAGGALGGALGMAGTGAMIGSMIAPGIGTAIGAAAGAIGGGIYGYYSTPAKPRDPVAESSNKHLAKIAALMEKQDKQTIGGGRRGANAYNLGDIQAAQLRILSGAVS